VDVRLDVYHGDNVSGAENQQERLIEFRGWVIGFVDGEGCFSIGFVRQQERPGRAGYKLGYQVAHEFAVTQDASGVACLEDLREFFGVGQIVANRRHDNHREHMFRYVVRKRTDLLDTVIPFFRRHPMRSPKQANFVKFADCVERVAAGRHKTAEGLLEIVEIAETMNRKKPRHDLVRILRGHTPDIRDSG
jgi:LAGLIDADG endonuclease